ncbi:hypothetical protein GGI13_000744 [Coemansia sp. RSA 455]|nr:hypothetical protein GGI08_001449 [Coemansia sp. S2]KAJ2070832.1 hypothetical protein GGH13_003757 [Coemansia sp. S155-1]KAJ2098620.1 hypothetical protein GGI09_003215 [Coemansia sp. S100]KAJ2107899.1 hypothetical protein GGI16_001346 [Coemansia sp. S142-1]KAJ2257955.1 hypothetical protein GGI13_000744 [Coemansia sp. RSA 455]KAJ2462903.1 hypothetical protein GGI03_004183 [Coemansia sp. RSA 2337]
MVCAICGDSYFKPGPARKRRAKVDGHLPVALSCGHTFHKRCANMHFNECDYCPTCDYYNDGSYTILYMDIDMDDSDAIRGPLRSHTSNDMDDLARDLMGVSIQDKSVEYTIIADLLRQNEELRSTTHSGRELAEAKRQLSIERERADKAERDLDAVSESHRIQLDRADWLDIRVEELERLSDRHRENIAGMQRSLQSKKELISEYEERYGYIW